MKKKLFQFSALVLLFAILFSCRNDYLAENEARNQSELPGLTSKTISLNESAHKNRIVPELKLAKENLAKKSVNIFSKVVNFGDVTIDTESVIYIENGPNFHTYTFNIEKTNPLPTDPIENLLLIPLSDRSYRELLISYNFTEEEKIILRNGGEVDRTNKMTVSELGNTYQNSIMGKSYTSCSYQDVEVIIPCTGGMHNASNISEWGSCLAGNAQNPDKSPPSMYTIVALVCEEVNETILPSEGGGGGESGGGGGEGEPGHPPTGPCVFPATNPGDIGIVDGNGCTVGVPTQPNLGDSDDDRTVCQILKDNSEHAVIQSKIDSLKNLVSLDNPLREHKETAITVRKGKSLTYKVFNKPIDLGFPGSIAVAIEYNNYNIIAMHNHYEDTFAAPQFGDIVSFYAGYKFLIPPRKNTYVFYTINYNGTEYAFRMNDTTALDTLFSTLNQNTGVSTKDDDKTARGKIYKLYEDNGFDKKADYTEEQAEKILMKVLKDKKLGSGNGIHLYRRKKVNTTTYTKWAKLKINANDIVTKEDCP